MLNLFSLRGLPWGSSSDDQEKVDCIVSISLEIIEIPILSDHRNDFGFSG